MDKKDNNKFLTVAPFECAWRQDLKFPEAGRGCVAFDAFAHNDVTVVFRENVGSKHYHYKRDSCPHYTVILGSHRNRRFKIEVDGKTVVDVEGAGLCCSSAFQSYWISIYDGLICVGKGRYPFQNLVFRWVDSNPNCNVRYVGLSSWDKHVGYRNINVLPLTQNHLFLWKQVGLGEHIAEEDEDEVKNNLPCYQKCGLQVFLENSDLSDVFFVVGEEERPVPAHKVILQASSSFPNLTSSNEDIVQLPEVRYPILHALLQYVYTGETQVSESQLVPLLSLSLKFEVMPLVKQCEEAIKRFKLNKKLFGSGKNVELSYLSLRPHSAASFPFGLPINAQKLQKLHLTSEYSDLNLYVEGHGLIAQTHKLILSLYSAPFAKMFTNGMSESNSSDVCIRDVSPEALKVMLDFMYSGELNIEDDVDKFAHLLLELLLFSDKFGITLLHQECCKVLLECLSEDSVCAILQAISSIQSCRLIQETCERKFSMHFDYCTTASLNFIYLDDEIFRNIIQHPDLKVTSEERVLDAILMWGVKAKRVCNWEVIDELIINSTPECVFQERLQAVIENLPFVRFPLLPYGLLAKLESSTLSRQLAAFDDLVKEAIKYIESASTQPNNEQNFRCQHRKSSFKELQYICDGDSNGVLYFSGTSYGQHQWVNPVLAKRITITASSPASRFTDPKVLVSRSYQGTSFAGPRLEGGQACAWWMVDLGEDHQLMCNYYTLRQDGSRTYSRFWRFEGSMDGVNWVELRVHENDQKLCKPGQFGSWPVFGPNSLRPLRFFRVVLTGPTTDASNPWNLCICFLELYGYFH